MPRAKKYPLNLSFAIEVTSSLAKAPRDLRQEVMDAFLQDVTDALQEALNLDETPQRTRCPDREP